MLVRSFQDSLRAALVHQPDAARPDSLSSPLPGGVAEVVRFFFNLPQWFQIGGFFVGLIVAAMVLRLLWRRRTAIATWFTTRERGVKIGLAAAAALLVVAVAGAGTVSWNYMQHDNGFCTGCHVMANPFGKFTARAGKHDSLQCHSCHQQSIFASTRQLYLWVAERPEKIGPHAKVPTAICAGCHISGADQRERWQRIATTAGHRTHLESDSTALKDVECVTCHGVEVHKFVPVDQTCAQSGCHDQTKIVLGKMAEQTSLHCVTCHQFTADVPRLATRDSASGTLVPTNKQCLSCHEMQRVLASFDPATDPHKGTCGMCHNPHTQSVAKEAAKSCTTSGCHDNWQKEPFHVGVAHRRAGESCLICHQPHAAKVDPSDCAGCHAGVRQRGVSRGKLPPLPFDTTKALKREASQATESSGGPVTGFLGWGWPTPPPRSTPTASADTFAHARHKGLTCLTCHTSNIRHGRLTFEPPRGCQICHHQAPKTAECAQCHQATELAKPLPIALMVRVPDRPTRTRPVGFTHSVHRTVTCLTCHVSAVSLKVDSAVATCRSCHEDHHQTGARCADCHTGDLKPSHARPIDGHAACDQCHATKTVAMLLPTRPLCVTCHSKEEDHYPAKECTLCHLQATPAGYRAHLLKRGTPQ